MDARGKPACDGRRTMRHAPEMSRPYFFLIIFLNRTLFPSANLVAM